MRRLDNSDDPNVLSKLAPCAKKSKEKRKLLRLRRVREGHLKWRVPKPTVCLSQSHVFDDVRVHDLQKPPVVGFGISCSSLYDPSPLMGE